MADTSKPKSPLDANQTLQKSYNDESGTLGVDGFVSGKVGHRVARSLTTTNVTDDTEVLTYSDSGTQLLVLHIVYTDGTLNTLLYVERVA